MIGAGEPVHGKKFPATRADWNVANATVLIDFILVFPVMVPSFHIDNVRWAVFVSHTIALVLMAGVAMIWTRYLCLNILKAGVIIGLICSVAVYSAYSIGW